MTDQYIFISSKDSLEEFPANKPFQFTSQLPSLVLLPTDPYLWTIGLVEICFTTDQIAAFGDIILVHLDEISYSVMHGEFSPVLRRIVNTNTTRVENYIKFNPVLYIPCSRQKLSQITVTIKNTDGSLASHLVNISYLTLQIRQRYTN